MRRRSFLKGTAMTVVGSTVRGEGALLSGAKELAEREKSTATAESRVGRINLLQGTDSSPLFSRGNTLPIAAMPFGMAHWTLQSQAGTPWMFHPKDRRIQGFRSTHQLSPWLSDYGQAVFLPFSGEVNPDPAARAASFRLEEARLSPCSIRLDLVRYRAMVELVPTMRCALLETVFGGEGKHGLLLEVPQEHVAMHADAARRTVQFASRVNEGGVPANFATYYVVKFDAAWTGFEVKEEQGRTVGLVSFPGEGRMLRARIGTSFISFEQAERNLRAEVGEASAEALRQRGEATWHEHLQRIVVEGGSASQQRIFDSCFYRALLFPRTWHEPDERGRPQHRSPYTGKVVEGVMYADHGYWDVYRAWYPFMTLFFPERLGEILQAWVNAYKEGGWLPQFPCPGYRACMTGSLIDAVFGDAAAKGITGFDREAAYEGLKKHATQVGDPDAGFGRRGIAYYLKLGYAPADHVDQSAAETVDAAYGDFCIAQMAQALGRQEDAAMFMQRSENWQKLFDRGSGFFRGKNEDGSWHEPLDPVTWGDPYVEGSAWQHRFDVPHDVAGMMAAYGGPEKMAAALEEMLAMPAVFNIGAYGREIHEMSEMAAVPYGQYAHSNQPVHHVLYLFAAAGRRDRTEYWVRRVMNELYREDAFAGDEDTGSMSAWFLLSAMGIYPVCPGKAEYTLGSPLFERVTWNVPGRKTMEIVAVGQGVEKVYVAGVVWNGRRYMESVVQHAALLEGGRVEFRMSAKPAG